MIREFCDLSGVDITQDDKFELSVLRLTSPEHSLAMPILTISAAEFVEIKKFLDNRKKV